MAWIFSEHGVLEYIKSCYGALHTTPLKGKNEGAVH